MIRCAAVFMIGSLLLASAPAHAGDYADRSILGFSADGSHYAFEEFGVQDGSGFAYSNIYLIDTDKDAWVSGTPIRVMHEDEDVPLEEVRAGARKTVAPLLARYGIVPAGQVVVSNPSSELSADPYPVRFLTNLYANWSNHAWTLTLTPLPFPDGEKCANLGPLHGFRLALENPVGEARILHEDTTVPASRGCPENYAIADVITDFPEGAYPVMVVLLHVISQGFEGPDRRFLAMATRFEDR